MRNIHTVLAIVALTLAACNTKPEATQVPSAGAGGMMGGAQMTAQEPEMVNLMSAQLDSLATMTPAQITAMMPAHEALASRMTGMMGSGMEGMNMQRDSGWMALNDSVQQDLTAMPGMSGDALQVRMQAHIGRMRRMMTMYQGMPHN